MANSILKFYKNDFPSETNTYVDDIENYLDKISSIVIPNFQYIRNDLKISIKVNLDQSYVEKFDYNYCSINNNITNEPIFYYFIDKTTQISPNTLQFELSMDTVNSLIGPRDFNSETEITRQHEDRFFTNVSHIQGSVLTRKINKVPEDITPTLIKSEDNTIRTLDNLDWYIIYRSDTTNGVSTELVASKPFVWMSKTQHAWELPHTYTKTTFPANDKVIWFIKKDNPFGHFTTPCQVNYCGPESYENREMKIGDEVCCFVRLGNIVYEKIYKLNFIGITTQPSTFKIYFNLTYLRTLSAHQIKQTAERADFDGYIIGFNDDEDLTPTVSLSSSANIKISAATKGRNDTNPSVNKTEREIRLISNYTVFDIGPVEGDAYTIDSIDYVIKTDSTLVKIINCPYCPVNISKYIPESGHYYYFEDAEWAPHDTIVPEGALSYSTFTTLLYSPKYGKAILPDFINNNLVNDVTPYINIDLTRLFKYTLPITPSLTSTKIIDLESKFYSSVISTTKFVYDSFSMEFKPENLNINASATLNYTPIIFKTTNTINSKFGFKLDVDRHGTYLGTQDFDNVLIVSRNNEYTILNDEYINYIRNGYNYDKKANALAMEQSKRQATTGTISAALTTAAAILDIAFGGKALGIGLLTSSAMQAGGTYNAWKNVNKLQESQENSLQAKLSQLAAQSASTSGTDDLDLMKWYSDNRLHYMRYTPTNEMRNLLYKAFDHTGYKTNKIGVPNVDSRIWYNYIECTPHIDYELTKTLKAEWLNDLKQKYKNGVEVFHHHLVTSGAPETYDFNRQYENWESWMI